MLKRGWYLIAGVWALLCLWGGANRGDGSGIEQKDVILAFAPLVVGWVIARAMRFVVTGSPAKPRGVITAVRRP
jgi:hypothetical protein